MISIDCSVGEGGGQIIRTALCFSLITQTPIHLQNIRYNRPKPGLAAQHLICVNAAVEISNGTVENAFLGSTTLTFYPNEICPGDYNFRIETAGSTALVIHTIVYPLILQNKPSSITISGGTHASFAPSYHDLKFNWLPHLHSLGIGVDLEIEKYGFFPVGGGLIKMHIPALISSVRPLNCIEKKTLVDSYTLLLCSKKSDAAINMFKDLIEKEVSSDRIEVVQVPSRISTIIPAKVAVYSTHSEFAFVYPKKRDNFETTIEHLKEKHLSVDQLGYADEHLEDQLLIPLCLFGGQFTSNCLSSHTETNIHILKMFDFNVEVEKQNETYFFSKSANE
eukprot:TRINITY_DN415_c0_g1_i1.p1 TRINITY_DN415_c0_g1~~TRINITY_DN415_c0_g1_i1.p1  ORF type:complete len:336 (-),score=74.83 TRINITY_DN415_c0_g1_i1:28-1035(-)